MRLAIAGCGVIGRFHVEVALTTPGVEVVALIDPIRSQRKKMADAHGLNIPDFDTLSDALAIGGFDTVAVCTPSGYHAVVGIEALNAGCHVVIEKPIDVDLSAAERLRLTAEREGPIATVISQHRFDPASQALHRAIAEGRLGRITSGVASVPWWRSQSYYDSSTWRGSISLDGGAVMNQGVHTVDLLCWFLGEPIEVFAWADRVAHERIQVEDVSVATVRFANGALATVHASTAANPGSGVFLGVYGTLGSATIENDQLTFFASTVGLLAEEQPVNTAAEEVEGLDAPEQPRTAVGGWAASDPSALGSSHARQYQDLLDAVATGRKPLVAAAEAIKPLRAIRGMYQSARIGRPVTLADIEF